VRVTEAVAVAREGAAEVAQISRQVYARAREERITFMAAAVAYYVFVSLLPLGVLLLVAASAIGLGGLATTVIGAGTAVFSPRIEDLLTDIVQQQAVGARVTLVGLPVVTWGALRTFRGVDAAFEQVYGAEERDSLPEALLDAAVVFTAMTLGATLMIVVGAVVTATTPIGNLLEPVALFVGLAIVFFPMYYLFPKVDPAPTEVLPGTLFAAGTWTAFQALFQLYAVPAGRASGALGTVLLMLTWLYGGSLLVLVGATLNAVLADRVEVDVDEELLPGYV
jgi:membrane protein